MEYKYKDYLYLSHKYWCVLLSIMEEKYNRKRAVDQIKSLAASKEAPEDSGSYASSKVPRNKKAITDVPPACNNQ